MENSTAIIPDVIDNRALAEVEADVELPFLPFHRSPFDAILGTWREQASEEGKVSNNPLAIYTKFSHLDRRVGILCRALGLP